MLTKGERNPADSGVALTELIGRQQTLRDLNRILDDGGVLLRGGPGTGKSAVLACAVVRAETRMDVIRIDASPLTRSIEFGAIATALPGLIGEHPLAPATVLARLTMLLSEGSGPRLIAVDDAHELDDSSAAAVEQLVRRGDLRLLAAHTAEQPLAAWVSSLVQHGYLQIVTLGPLCAREIHELGEQVLGGPCDPRLGEELWDLSHGNPLRARLLLKSGKENASLIERNGRWRVSGSWPTHGTLADAIEERLSVLSASAREVLDTLAIAGPLELDVLARLFSHDAIEKAETARAVRIDVEGLRATACVVDRLLTEHLTARLLTTRRRRLAANAARGLLATGARRRRDALRITLLQVEAGIPIAGADALRATQLALLDADVTAARRLVGQVRIDGVAPFERALIVGQVALAEGELDEADWWLQEAESLVDSDGELTRVAIARAELIARGRGSFALAIEFVGAALATVTHENWRQSLRVEIARLALITGEALTADEMARAVVGNARASQAVAGEALAISAAAQVEAGQFADVEALSKRVSMVARDSNLEPLARLSLAQVEALSYAGHLAEARNLAERATAGNAATAGSWEVMQGKIFLTIGEIAGATALLQDARVSLESTDPLDHWWRANAYLALAHSQAGDIERLTAALAPPDWVGHPDFVARIIAGRAAAWVPALQGDLARAAQKLRRVGLEALDHYHFALAATTLHDAVRLGKPEVVIGDLSKIADGCEGALSPAYTAHAIALAGGDRRALVDVAARFEDAGALLLAAETLNQAAALFDAANGGAVDRAAARASVRLADCCPGARTPALLERPTDLTPRQAEVARMAVHLHSEEIAERLHLSVRTVESHLETAFQKLGIHRRSELPGSLGEPPVGTD